MQWLIAQTPPEKGRIEGILISQTTNQPLRKGTLILRPVGAGRGPAGIASASTYAVTSDVEGRFLIDQVEPGHYMLTAEYPGYLHGTYLARGSTDITIASGQTIANLRFGLTPYAVISGRVIDEDGNSRTEVQVSALRHGWSNGRRQLIGTGLPTSVDDQGSFRIANLLPGRYTLYARVARTAMANTGAEATSYVTTYYPNALDISEATPVIVAAGAEVSVTIRLRKERVFRVQGKAVDAASGTPVHDSLVLELRPRQGNPGFVTSPTLPTAVVRGSSFELVNILPGSYTIEPSSMNVIIWGRESIIARFFGQCPVTVTNRDLTDVIVPLRAGVTIAGAITTEEGAQAALASPERDSQTRTRPAVRLVAERLAARDFGAPSKDDGTFELHDVAPERYRVHLLGLPEGTYVKSVRVAREDITNGILDLTTGVGAVLEIVVSPKAADVTGTVHNSGGENAADVLVTLAPISVALSADPLLFRQVRAGQNGQFKIKNLAPGEYQVLAWEDVDVNLAMDPEFRAHFDSHARIVKLREGSHEGVSLKLLPRDTIEAEELKLP